MINTINWLAGHGFTGAEPCVCSLTTCRKIWVPASKTYVFQEANELYGLFYDLDLQNEVFISAVVLGGRAQIAIAGLTSELEDKAAQLCPTSMN